MFGTIKLEFIHFQGDLFSKLLIICGWTQYEKGFLTECVGPLIDTSLVTFIHEGENT